MILMDHERFVNRWNALKILDGHLSHARIMEIADAKTDGNPVSEQEIMLIKNTGMSLPELREAIQDALNLGLVEIIKTDEDE